MPHINNEQRVEEWLALISLFPAAAAAEVAHLAQTHAEDLAEHFYRHMLNDPFSAAFLSHEQVKARLGQSMQRWIVTVFTANADSDLNGVVELQQHIGQVHARIEIPVSLVMRGARHLKQRTRELLSERQLDPGLERDSIRLATEIIDLALEIMCSAFSQSHDRSSRAEEAYRLFSISQNIGAEKERQRGALLDWENQLMFDLAMQRQLDSLPTLHDSEFGLWFRHKAAHAFQGSPEATAILDHMRAVDKDLPELAAALGGTDAAARHRLLKQVRDYGKSIMFLLEGLFDQANDLESGRDVLTRLLNRKFLPVVMGKEINYSRQTGNNFGVLAIDVDHFKQINDRYGHDGGDLVLQQIAALLANSTRSGDYAFRLGGEEFLVVLVDVTEEKAMTVAEKLRLNIAREQFQLKTGNPIGVTVSVGVSLYDGHPDFERLLRRADQALYQAKNSGRNRSVLA
jgi:diguanylate cyclase